MTDYPNLQVVSDIPDDTLKQYLASDVLAVDTELQGLNWERDKVCLVQLCDRQGTVTLVRPGGQGCPPNLKKLMLAPNVLKVMHYALSDALFIKADLGVEPFPVCCTKVMSKLVRTYTSNHGLKDLVAELAQVTLDKESQQTNWGLNSLTPKQLQYAANDVIHLVKVYDGLKKMIQDRGNLPNGQSLDELNRRTQAFLPTLVDLLLSGYGDRDNGWEVSVFNH